MVRKSGFFAFEKRPDENAWLDLLRALAITLVLLRHGYVSSTPPHAAKGSIGFFALNGWIGVDLFFVLSGYLISRHLLRAGFGTPAFSYKRYLTMRALRIVPAYFAVLALILMSAFPFYRIAEDHLGWRTAYHLVFLQDYLPANFNVAFWSLGVEEKFYLAAPILLWVILTRRNLAWGMALLAVLFALPVALRTIIYFSQDLPIDYQTFFERLRSPFHASLESLVVGVAIAVADRAGALRLSQRHATAIFAAAAVALVLWLASDDFMGTITAFDAVFQPVIIACLCGLLLVGAIRMPALANPLEPVTRVVARLSYALYLVHFPLVPLSVVLARHSALPGPTFWLAFLGSSFLVAGLLHYAVEKPFLLWKEYLSRTRFRRPATLPSAPLRTAQAAETSRT